MKILSSQNKNFIIGNSIGIGNYKLRILFIGLFVYLFIGLFSQVAGAQSSSNTNYNLEIQDIDKPSEQNEKSQTLIETQSENAEEVDPSGIQYISQLAWLSFTTSSGFLDFGALSSGNPVVRKLDLSILSDSTDYQVVAFQDHQLKGPNNEIIADTTCDNGTCTEEISALWSNNLTYGFGVRCVLPGSFDEDENISCMGFPEAESYKQLADIEKSEYPSGLIAGHKSKEPQQAQVSLKLNTSGTQQSGSYSNTVTVIAVPNY